MRFEKVLAGFPVVGSQSRTEQPAAVMNESGWGFNLRIDLRILVYFDLRILVYSKIP